MGAWHFSVLSAGKPHADKIIRFRGGWAVVGGGGGSGSANFIFMGVGNLFALMVLLAGEHIHGVAVTSRQECQLTCQNTRGRKNP